MTSPFRFPAYYPEETHGFVHLLEPQHISLTVELRSVDGTPVLEHGLLGEVVEHPSRDLVVIPLSDDVPPALEQLLEDSTVSLEALADTGEARAPAAGAAAPPPLLFLGHVVAGEAVTPWRVPGVWLGRSDRQAFARTAEVLVTGMCGGPVLQQPEREGQAAQQRQLCVGMVEGVVPAQPSNAGRLADTSAASPRERAAALLAGSAAIIEGREIAAFVRAVESRRGVHATAAAQ